MNRRLSNMLVALVMLLIIVTGAVYYLVGSEPVATAALYRVMFPVAVGWAGLELVDFIGQLITSPKKRKQWLIMSPVIVLMFMVYLMDPDSMTPLYMMLIVGVYFILIHIGRAVVVCVLARGSKEDGTNDLNKP